MSSDDIIEQLTPEERHDWDKSRHKKQVTLFYALTYMTTLLAGILILIFTPAMTGGPGVTYWQTDHEGRSAALLTALSILVLGGLMSIATCRATAQEKLSSFKASREVEIKRLALENDRKTTSLDLLELWKVTEQRMSVYHDMAEIQARESYTNSRRAINVGFALLLVSVFIAAFTSSLTGAIAAGVIGTSGTALTAYLTRTFLRMHESSSSQLRSYFDQPLQLSRQLAAERLLGLITNRKIRDNAVLEHLRSQQLQTNKNLTQAE